VNMHLAISGGHSKSSAFVFTDDIKALGAAEGERINLHTDGSSTAARSMFNLLNNLARRVSNGRWECHQLLEECSSVRLVCAGAASRTDQDTIMRELIEPRYETTKFLIADDTWAGLLAGTLGYRGTCAFAGTGASVYVGTGDFPSGREHKIDGWGPIIGDYGSGFQLAVDLFREMGRIESLTGAPPPFFKLLTAHVNDLLEKENFPSAPLDDFESVQAWFDSLVRDSSSIWRVRFAQLSKAVTVAASAKNPDTFAVKLVKQSAEQMGESLAIAAFRWPEIQELPLVFQGGMFENSLLYRETVKSLASKNFHGSIFLPKYKPLMGAAFLALAEMGATPKLHEVQQLTDSILGLPIGQRELLIRSDHDAEYPHGISGQHVCG
jgi:N-acetylglucosamine kinase-like BadF-type ATPase